MEVLKKADHKAGTCSHNSIQKFIHRLLVRTVAAKMAGFLTLIMANGNLRDKIFVA